MNAAAAQQYRAHQHGSAHDIVERHGELVRRIAHHLAARLPVWWARYWAAAEAFMRRRSSSGRT